MDALIVCSVVAGIGLFMGLAALVLAAEHQADIPELREEVDRLRSALDRMGGVSMPIPGPVEALGPRTEPIRLPVPEKASKSGGEAHSGSTAWRTDTAHAAAVTEAAARRVLDAERYGRHAHRMPR